MEKPDIAKLKPFERKIALFYLIDKNVHNGTRRRAAYSSFVLFSCYYPQPHIASRFHPVINILRRKWYSPREREVYSAIVSRIPRWNQANHKATIKGVRCDLKRLSPRLIQRSMKLRGIFAGIHATKSHPMTLASNDVQKCRKRCRDPVQTQRINIPLP